MLKVACSFMNGDASGFRIVAVGGGTGLSILLRCLKR